MNKNPTLDQRVYNAPSSEEVATILIDDLPSNESRSPYIVVWGKSKKHLTVFITIMDVMILCSICYCFQVEIVDGTKAYKRSFMVVENRDNVAIF